MPVTIYLINNKNETFSLGCLNVEDVILLGKIAAANNLHNLPYIDFIGETIFNHRQIDEMKSEINHLNRYNEISKSLDIIQQIIEQIPNNSQCYIKFSGE